MYSTFIAYLLWFLSCFGWAGFHRFYLGKPFTGILWIITGGLGGIGSIYDLVTLPRQVQEANMGKTLKNHINSNHIHTSETRETWHYADDAQYKVMNTNSKREKEHPERIILKLARENKGILTVSEVALGADISVDEAKKMLEALVSKGFAELRVRQSGSLVYVIPDMADKDEPLEDI